MTENKNYSEETLADQFDNEPEQPEPQPPQRQRPRRSPNKRHDNIYQDKPRDYVRIQKGHSLSLQIVLLLITGGMWLPGWVLIPYWSASPNHYWHF